MQVSSISEASARKNLFIKYANSFMSNPTEDTEAAVEKTKKDVPEPEVDSKSKGIETLTTFSIFPKQVINGQTIITA